jgi:UDP-2,3-diacylglucosamine pyrophosphatase LpxH
MKTESYEETYETVILSDLHLGSEISRASDAIDLLHSLRFRRLILLGDIFCDLNFRRLKKEHWHFLSHIRKLSNPKRGVEVVWVEGNHDYGLVDVMSHLVGVPAYREYIWESGGKRHLAIHGHQFDNFIIKNHLFMNGIANQLYLFIQKLSAKGKWVARVLDNLNTRWQRLTPKVAEGAIAYARSRGAAYVYCGHP